MLGAGLNVSGVPVRKVIASVGGVRTWLWTAAFLGLIAAGVVCAPARTSESSAGRSVAATRVSATPASSPVGDPWAEVRRRLPPDIPVLQPTWMPPAFTSVQPTLEVAEN